MTDHPVGEEQITQPHRVAISLLGDFQVTVTDQSNYKFRTAKSRALLAYLVLAGEQPAPRTVLTELLWPGYLAASARTSLRQALTDLRKLPSLDTQLHTDYHSVHLRLDPTLVTCDALRFDELLAACEQHAHAAIGNCLPCQNRLRAAMALYRGAFLENFPAVDSDRFTRWVEAQRAHYAERMAYCQSLLNHSVGAPPKALGNLPTPLTPLIGRDQELHALTPKLVHPVYRCLTLVGPGGIGKTRLALALGSATVEAFPDGVWVVDLGALAPAVPPTPAETKTPADSDAASGQTELHDRLAAAMLAALGLGLQGAVRPTRQLQTYLQEKTALLILDNFEHVSDSAVYLAQLLQAAPAVRLLITSRHRLALQGQQIYRVAGLAWPTTAQVTATPATTLIADYPSVALFLERSTLTETVLTPDGPTLAAVAEICELVEGVPLALELAAALLETHTLSALAGLIRENYQVLASTFHDLPPRQRSMRAMLQTAWRLLAVEEAQLLARCAVFQGGFTLDAARTAIDATSTTLSDSRTCASICR
jgi:predicted ATPase